MTGRVYRYTVKRSRVAESLARFSGPHDVAPLARKLIGEADRETFLAFFLDARHAVIGWETIAIGTLQGVEVHPREVFRGAILAGAAAIIVSHNHPSGDTAPSAADRELTARLTACGDLIGIPVLDHVIVSDRRSFSFAEEA